MSDVRAHTQPRPPWLPGPCSESLHNCQPRLNQWGHPDAIMCISAPLIILQFLWYSVLKSPFRCYSEKVSDGMDQQLESPVQGKDRGRQGHQCPEQSWFPHLVLPRLYEVDVTIASVTASRIPWGLENKFHSWPTVELGRRPLSLPLGLLPVHRVKDRCRHLHVCHLERKSLNRQTRSQSGTFSFYCFL